MHWQFCPGLLAILIAQPFLAACGGSGKHPQPISAPVMVPAPTPSPVPPPTPDPTPTPTLSVTTPNAFPSLPGLANPVGLYQAPGDDGRWFIVEQAGRVRIVAN